MNFSCSPQVSPTVHDTAGCTFRRIGKAAESKFTGKLLTHGVVQQVTLGLVALGRLYFGANIFALDRHCQA